MYRRTHELSRTRSHWCVVHKNINTRQVRKRGQERKKNNQSNKNKGGNLWEGVKHVVFFLHGRSAVRLVLFRNVGLYLRTYYAHVLHAHLYNDICIQPSIFANKYLAFQLQWLPLSCVRTRIEYIIIRLCDYVSIIIYIGDITIRS